MYRTEEIRLPLQLVFDGTTHPAYPRTHENSAWFEARIRDMELKVYTMDTIASTDVPRKFRTGSGHFTNIVPVADPAEYVIDHFDYFI